MGTTLCCSSCLWVSVLSFYIVMQYLVVREREREGERERQTERERDDCFTLTVFLIYCDYLCYVALPHSAPGWSSLYDCGIS